MILYQMEKKKLIDRLKDGSLTMHNYLENLQLVVDKDTETIG